MCRINCCLHRACRLQTPSTACIKESTRSTLWNFYSLCSLFFPFPSLSSFSFSPPCPPLPFSFSSATKQTRKTSLSRVFSAPLPSCPEALQYLVSCSISLLCLPGAKRLGMKRKEEKGGLDQEEMWERLSTEQGERLWYHLNYSNYRCRNTQRREERSSSPRGWCSAEAPAFIFYYSWYKNMQKDLTGALITGCNPPLKPNICYFLSRLSIRCLIMTTEWIWCLVEAACAVLLISRSLSHTQTHTVVIHQKSQCCFYPHTSHTHRYKSPWLISRGWGLNN